MVFVFKNLCHDTVVSTENCTLGRPSMQYKVELPSDKQKEHSAKIPGFPHDHWRGLSREASTFLCQIVFPGAGAFLPSVVGL